MAGAGAACPAKAECWGGLVSIAGDTTARRIDCGRPHSWQTYAIAPLPQGTRIGDLASLEDHPAVRKVCSGTVMFASMHDQRNDRESRWHGTVLAALPGAVPGRGTGLPVPGRPRRPGELAVRVRPLTPRRPGPEPPGV
ncbi:hypothetical protein GCM10017559_74470 [Streptosporangium longisporum]|uniref:Uncharacterized protein n=1 Tax=Streptosporangium longisporum TaxID=46187 RepID=A0ABP6LB03_9ACTN